MLIALQVPPLPWKRSRSRASVQTLPPPALLRRCAFRQCFERAR